VSSKLRLEFTSNLAKGKLADLTNFTNWRNSPGNRYWIRRRTDTATRGSSPLQDRYQNLFSMTLTGTAMLDRFAKAGVSVALSSASIPPTRRVVFETYPSAVAERCGFKGSYKREPEKCLQKAEEYLETDSKPALPVVTATAEMVGERSRPWHGGPRGR
jgi:hypothetical protein